MPATTPDAAEPSRRPPARWPVSTRRGGQAKSMLAEPGRARLCGQRCLMLCLMPLSLTQDERAELEAWLRRPTTPQRFALRAQIVLAASEGRSNTAIAA